MYIKFQIYPTKIKKKNNLYFKFYLNISDFENV